MGVLNVRTLNEAEFKQSELTYVFGKIGIDFLGQYKLVTSTASRNQRLEMQPVEDSESYSAKRPLKLLKKFFHKQENPNFPLWWQPSYNCHSALCSCRGIR